MRLITKYKLVCTLAIMVLVSVCSIFLQEISLIEQPQYLVGLIATLVSASAGPEGFVITTLIFFSIPFFLRFKLAHNKIVLITFMLILACAYGIKTPLKSATAEPRPFVETIVHLGAIDSVDGFYALSDAGKEVVIDSIAFNTDEWRLQEWKNEWDYALPSGHMLFAALIVVFWAPILMVKGYFITAVTSVAWASSVGGSRLWLGMHRLEDLYASIFIALILCLFVPRIVRRLYREEKPVSHDKYRVITV